MSDERRRDSEFFVATDEPWDINDLKEFTDSIFTLYNSLIIFNWKLSAFRDNHDLIKRRRIRYEEWHYYYRKYRETPPFDIKNDYEISDILGLPKTKEIFENIDEYVDESQVLRIKRIRMESPGDFSFIGIDKIIKQIRFLIRDIWYENEQRKIKTNLEIAKEIMKLEKDGKERLDDILEYLNEKENRKIVDKIRESLNKLSKLRRKKKLKDIE